MTDVSSVLACQSWLDAELDCMGGEKGPGDAGVQVMGCGGAGRAVHV